MWTVKQLADEMNISKTAVMRKIKILGLELPREGQTIVINDAAADMIRESFNRKPNRQPQTAKFSNNRKLEDATDNQLECAENEEKIESADADNRQPTTEKFSNNRKLNDEVGGNVCGEVCGKNEPKTYSADYVQSLLARIEGLEADKADLKAEKIQMQLRIDEKDAHIMEITERLTVLLKNEQDKTALMAAPAADVKIERAEDVAEPEKKKPWWKFW